MESVDAKMIRPHEHLQAFERELNEYLSTIEFKLYLKTSPDYCHPWLVVHANDYIPPIHLSTVTGDCVHNMRSALDSLVCGLARSVDRSSNCRKVKFPFTENEADWTAKSSLLLQCISPKAGEIIKSVQPWYDAITPQPLLMLNKLNNLDKHESCAPTLAYSHNTRFRIHCTNGSIIEVSPEEPIYLGDVKTFTLPIASRLVGDSAKIDSSGTYVVIFKDKGPWGNLHAVDVLQRCFDHVETRVVGRLKRFFELSAQQSSD